MRTAHWKAHLLPLLLMSLYSVSVCLAANCIFDDYVTKFAAPNIATAEDQPKGQVWEPLRIVASTEDFQGSPKPCVKKDGSTGERGSQGAGSDCTVIFATVTTGERNILMGIVERAIALHTDRLLVQRATGPLKIPDLSNTEYCKYFNVPAKHRTDGVPNADMVLYVGSTSARVDDASALSLGVTCAKSAGGRPIAGALALGPSNVEVNRYTVRLAAHQIAHALGFIYSEMKSHNMIVDKTVREKPNQVAVVNSEKTKQVTQAHYGCSTADGMELEDGSSNDKKTLSHWERRNAKDELMAEPVGGLDESFMGFYTKLSMAAFEDLGYYKANFEMAEHMEYGHNTGCEFLTGKCMNKGVTKWPHMFCNDRKSDEGPFVCTTNRFGLGVCSLDDDINPPLPVHFQYFTSDKIGEFALSLTDYCPVVEQGLFYGCTNTEKQGKRPGSLFGENSMCLDGSALKATMDGDTVTVGDVCAEISCSGGTIMVRYLGDKNWHDCPKGQSLTPSSTSKAFVSGTIKCPKYEEVCVVAPDGSRLVPRATHEPMKPTSKTTASPTGSDESNREPNDPNSGGKSKDGSSVPFGLIPSVAFLVLSFAGYLIA